MNNVISALQFLTDKHVPLRKQTSKQMKQLAKAWLTKAVLNSIKQRQKRFVTHFLSNDPEKIRFYKTYNNKLNRTKEAAKKLYFQNQFSLNRENLKTTWKLIGFLINREKIAANYEINYKNRCYTDKASVAHQLSTHFINVGQVLADKIPNSNQQPRRYIKRTFRESFRFSAILVNEMCDLLSGLNLRVSSIGVPRRCIKLGSTPNSECLTTIFNDSLLQGVVPDALKISKVTPVDKGCEITHPFNFRPISTLSTFTQVLEKLVYKQIINYKEKQNIIYQCQFGFRKG